MRPGTTWPTDRYRSAARGLGTAVMWTPHYRKTFDARRAVALSKERQSAADLCEFSDMFGDWNSPSVYWCLRREEEGPGSWRAYGEREADQPRDGVSSSGLSRAGPLCCVETDTAELQTVGGTNESEKLRFIWIRTRARGSVEARIWLFNWNRIGWEDWDIGYWTITTPNGSRCPAAEVG